VVIGSSSKRPDGICGPHKGKGVNLTGCIPFSAEAKNERICTSARLYVFMACVGTTLIVLLFCHEPHHLKISEFHQTAPRGIRRNKLSGEPATSVVRFEPDIEGVKAFKPTGYQMISLI
jgi:hypothetical protein